MTRGQLLMAHVHSRLAQFSRDHGYRVPSVGIGKHQHAVVTQEHVLYHSQISLGHFQLGLECQEFLLNAASGCSVRLSMYAVSHNHQLSPLLDVHVRRLRCQNVFGRDCNAFCIGAGAGRVCNHQRRLVRELLGIVFTVNGWCRLGPQPQVLLRGRRYRRFTRVLSSLTAGHERLLAIGTFDCCDTVSGMNVIS